MFGYGTIMFIASIGVFGHPLLPQIIYILLIGLELLRATIGKFLAVVGIVTILILTLILLTFRILAAVVCLVFLLSCALTSILNYS